MSPAHLWMLIGIIGGIVVLAIALAFAATFLLRRRRLRKAQHNDPYLTRKEFTRRRKMSKVDRMEEEELERRAIIRKSLASKTSSRTSQAISERLSIDEDDEAEISPTNSLRDDWKEWEARMQRERSNSVQDHPLLLSRLDIPSQTRSQSPIRRAAVTSKTASHPALLPPLPPLPTD